MAVFGADIVGAFALRVVFCRAGEGGEEEGGEGGE